MVGEGAFGSRLRKLGLGAGLIFLSQWILMSDDQSPLRTINLKVVADEEFKVGCENWCFYLKTLVRAVSRDFEERFGIRFRAEQVGSWMSDDSRQSPYGLFNDLRSRINKGKCDAVVGFTAQDPFESAFSGVCSYTQGYVLIRKGLFGSWVKNTLKHELCHLLGAVDIADPDSVMGIQNRGDSDRFDEFSAALIGQNRGRGFQPGRFPLSGPNLDRVIEICSDRHKKIPLECGVMELLALLYLETQDWDALKRICLEAVASAAGSVEAHNLMGLAYYNLKEYGAAVQEFLGVLRLEPCHPDAYYNLALSYLRSGRVNEARENCEKALALLPGSPQALSTIRELQSLQDPVRPAGSPSLVARHKARYFGQGKDHVKKKKE